MIDDYSVGQRRNEDPSQSLHPVASHLSLH